MDTPPDELDATIRSALADIRASGTPYHLILGSQPDPGCRTWHMQALPASLITVLADGGHFPHLAHPAEFAGHLAATETW